MVTPPKLKSTVSSSRQSSASDDEHGRHSPVAGPSQSQHQKQQQRPHGQTDPSQFFANVREHHVDGTPLTDVGGVYKAYPEMFPNLPYHQQKEESDHDAGVAGEPPSGNPPSQQQQQQQPLMSFPPAGTVPVAYFAGPGGSIIAIPQLKTKRRQVKNACTNCQKACKKCDEVRPCGRCVKYGIDKDCIDSQRKERKKGVKRGPYKKREHKSTDEDEQANPMAAAAASQIPMLTPENAAALQAMGGIIYSYAPPPGGPPILGPGPLPPSGPGSSSPPPPGGSSKLPEAGHPYPYPQYFIAPGLPLNSEPPQPNPDGSQPHTYQAQYYAHMGAYATYPPPGGAFLVPPNMPGGAGSQMYQLTPAQTAGPPGEPPMHMKPSTSQTPSPPTGIKKMKADRKKGKGGQDKRKDEDSRKAGLTQDAE